MELLGYIEEYGVTKQVTLLRNDYEPADHMQRLYISLDGKGSIIWARLVAVEQMLFDANEMED